MSYVNEWQPRPSVMSIYENTALAALRIRCRRGSLKILEASWKVRRKTKSQLEKIPRRQRRTHSSNRCRPSVSATCGSSSRYSLDSPGKKQNHLQKQVDWTCSEPKTGRPLHLSESDSARPIDVAAVTSVWSIVNTGPPSRVWIMDPPAERELHLGIDLPLRRWWQESLAGGSGLPARIKAKHVSPPRSLF